MAERQISRGKARDLRSIHPSHIRQLGPGDIGLRVTSPPRPPGRRLLCASCSSGRSFAYSFLSTTPRDDAVAVQLGVPVTKVPRGLSPPSHFPPWLSPGGCQRRSRRCAPCPAHKETGADPLRADPCRWRITRTWRSVEHAAGHVKKRSARGAATNRTHPTNPRHHTYPAPTAPLAPRCPPSALSYCSSSSRYIWKAS